MNLERLWDKHRDVVPYIVFGVLTTVVNVAVYWMAAHLLGFSVMPSTVIAWVLAVLFAYVTNRKWVFRSEAKGAAAIAREMIAFFACRLATGALDVGCMFLFVDVLAFDDVVVKAAANVLVIVLNYVASRLVIFRRRKS